MKTFSTLSRTIAFAVVLCLCAAFVPAMTFAAEVTPGTILVNGSDTVDKDNTVYGGITYDPTTNVVTLKDVQETSIQFTFTTPFTVKLEGTNQFGKFIANQVGEMTIEGPGTLNLVHSADWSFDFAGPVVINGGTVNMTSTGWNFRFVRGLTINGGTVTSSTTNASGQCFSNKDGSASNLVINGGKVTMTGRLALKNATFTMTGGELNLASAQFNPAPTKVSFSGGKLTVNTNGFASAIPVEFTDGKTEIISTQALNVSSISVAPAASLKWTTDVAVDYSSKVTDTGVVYVPGASFADNGAVIETADYVTVGGQNLIVNGENPTLSLPVGEGSVSYDPDTATVTLNNVTAGKILFNLHKDFNLNIVGENTVSSSAAKVVEVLTGNVTVDGDGTLTAQGTDEVIYIAGNYTQNGATVISHATGYSFLAAAGDITINDGTLTGTGTTSAYRGMHALGDVRISGGVVNAHANSNVIISENKSVTIEGGTVTAVANNAETLRASNGSISLLGGTVNLQAAGRVFLLNGSGSLTVDSDVKLIAKTSGETISSKAPVLAEDIRFVTGKSFADNSGEIETLVGDETDYNLPGEGTVVVNVTLNGEADNGREVQLWQGDTLVETQTASEEGVVFFKVNPIGVGEHVYTVKVVGENGNGYTFAEAQTVTVTVDSTGLATAAPVTLANTYVEPRLPYLEGEIVDGKYIVTETGKATEMGLIKIGDDYYYAGPNGVLVTGKYYAWRLNENCDITTGWYYFDSTGKLVDSGIVDGYYYVNGKPTEMGLFKHTDGNYYVAQYDGKIIKAQKYYVWKIDESAKDAFAEGWYEFDENGVIIPLKNGIVDGYYYVDGKPAEMGLFEYEGNYYVAQYDGKIITSANYTTYGAGKYYVWKIHESASEIATGWYYFGADGAMLQGICEHPEKGGLYYFENGKVKEMGLFLNEADGFYYVAQYDGKIITSENYTKYGAGKYYVWKIHESASDIKAGWYFFNAEGQMIWKNNTVYAFSIPAEAANYADDPDPKAYNGSVFFDGVEYEKSFVEDGVAFTSGLVNVGSYVHNDTDSAAYARVVYLLDHAEDGNHCICGDYFHATYNSKAGKLRGKTITIDGKAYDVYTFTYNDVVEAGANTRLGMYQYFWNKYATDMPEDFQVKFINQLSADGSFEAITAEYVAELFN